MREAGIAIDVRGVDREHVFAEAMDSGEQFVEGWGLRPGDEGDAGFGNDRRDHDRLSVFLWGEVEELLGQRRDGLGDRADAAEGAAAEEGFGEFDFEAIFEREHQTDGRQ